MVSFLPVPSGIPAVLLNSQGAHPVGVGAVSQRLIPTGGTIWIADAHCGDKKTLVVRTDDKLTAFMELDSVRLKSHRPATRPLASLKRI